MPKNPTLEEMEIAKTTLSKIKDFANVEILDTWFEDIWKLEEEIKEKQKHLRKVKKERKLQPSLNVETIKSKELKKIDSGYQIIIGNDVGSPTIQGRINGNFNEITKLETTKGLFRKNETV